MYAQRNDDPDTEFDLQEYHGWISAIFSRYEKFFSLQ